MKIALLLLVGFGLPMARAQEVSLLSFPPAQHMTRAELWFARTVKTPKAVLVLCPGMNGSGKSLVRDPRWQAFAKKNQLGLVGLSFASKNSDLFSGHDYTYPEEGSGELLLQGIEEYYGKALPLFLYGFSSGAFFTEMMVNWHPSQVLAWCAHGTGRYEENPRPWPPGIVSCGEQDHSRYGASLMHFKKGRAAGSKLLWVSLPENGHDWPGELHAFVREYFEAVLRQSPSPLWVDIDSEKVLNEKEARHQPSLSGWLPSDQLVEPWKKLHQP